MESTTRKGKNTMKNTIFKSMLEFGIIITSSDSCKIYEHKGYLIKTQEFYYCTLKLLDKEEIYAVPVTYIAVKESDKIPKYPFICVN